MRSWAPLLFASLAGCGSVEYGTIEYGTYAAGSYAYGASPYVAPEQAYGVSPPSAEARLEIEVFLRELAPYGEWIEDPTYGRVFVPNDPDYRPFRNGQWVEEGEELAWLSYDAIGWAVCHYGSWTVLEDGRWAWIPGEEWAPARVDWRETDEYVGWAPRMVSGYPDPTMWMFVQSTYLLIDHVYTYAIDPGYAQSVYAGGRPMSGFPSRRWRADRGVRAARGGAVAVRPHRG
ncbi:MAG: hypothetical protein KF729_24265, partial [Sandaracinaceae bacterium]|nr:hypothetical protein [Sandaracinaceae bacterium]